MHLFDYTLRGVRSIHNQTYMAAAIFVNRINCASHNMISITVRTYTFSRLTNLAGYYVRDDVNGVQIPAGTYCDQCSYNILRTCGYSNCYFYMFNACFCVGRSLLHIYISMVLYDVYARVRADVAT